VDYSVFVTRRRIRRGMSEGLREMVRMNERRSNRQRSRRNNTPAAGPKAAFVNPCLLAIFDNATKFCTT
jgi:hypothetical protein